jgi:hypothetical protein
MAIICILDSKAIRHNFILCRERIKQRLVLYRGVMPIYMQFSDDAEETFSRALRLLVVSDFSAV